MSKVMVELITNVSETLSLPNHLGPLLNLSAYWLLINDLIFRIWCCWVKARCKR